MHNEFIAEVNTLRSQVGGPVSTVLRAPSATLLAIMEVKNQLCGEFPDGCGSPSDAEEKGVR